MLDEFMGACDLIQWQNLRDVEPPPLCFKSLIDVASRFDRCLGWHIVAAHKKSLAFTKTSCQTGVSAIGTFVA
jgi:hypothetical protein